MLIFDENLASACDMSSMKFRGEMMAAYQADFQPDMSYALVGNPHYPQPQIGRLGRPNRYSKISTATGCSLSRILSSLP